MTKRRKFSDQFKAKVTLEALRGDRTIQEIAAKQRVSDLLCMNNLVHASATKEHDNDDNFQGLIRPTS
jgi:hypothetical protein